ncbi:hypothetical protein [Halalkalicoccus subterraneus]|uniref:hypothetical protein n=1 Tax=Halalkalicoccus subterraneus TaxID=2675002 RepID=UPI000EFC2150|nr:hypothetical protein [Halalkalicoccus subterraneus]
MSSRTSEECVTLAADTAADQDARSHAIHELKLANECDELAKLVLNENIETQFRQQALQSLETPQCDSMLQRLVEDDSLPQSLQQEAEKLLEETENS